MYIKDSICISPQNTVNNEFFDFETINYIGNKYISKEPAYKKIIPIKLLRRMGKAVRMGVGAGSPLVKKYKNIEGIIIGTANGGLEDCVKFLNQIHDYDEGNLTPTNFIQSTANSIAGHLAISEKNTSYNITNVHKGLAFENSLLDAKMLFEEGKKRLLVGSVEEISEYNYNIDFLANLFKDEEVDSENLLKSNTKGTVCGEGSAMFILENEKNENNVEIVDIAQISYPENDEILEITKSLLSRNNLNFSDIDTLVLGYNGDNRTDFLYDNFSKSFSDTSIYTYKNLVGEYPTSSAFAVWFSANILQGKNPPKTSIIKMGNRESENLLIYNHYVAEQHALILLRK